MIASFPASAATLSMPDSILRILHFTGPIVAGDAERLVEQFTKTPSLSNGGSYYRYPGSLELSSPGGDVAEAIRIASLVRALGLRVHVGDDRKNYCASSCFLVFLGGLPRDANGIDTIRRVAGKQAAGLGPVGVHRPYFSQIADGQAGAVRQTQLMSQMSDYLRGENVPQALIDKMMTSPSNEIYWLTRRDLDELGEYPPGVEEQLISRCRYVRGFASKLKPEEWIKDLESGVGACVSDYMIEHYKKAPIVERLRTGWRPWH